MRGLRRRSAAARLLGSWIQIPTGAWMFECCVLAGRGLCEELITRPEDSYILCCFLVCVKPRNFNNEEPMACVWPQRHKKKKNVFMNVLAHINKWMCTAEGMYFFARALVGTHVCSKNTYMCLRLIEQLRLFTCLWVRTHLLTYVCIYVWTRHYHHDIHIFTSNGSRGTEHASDNSYTNKRALL